MDEIARAMGRAEVDGRERRIEVDRIIDILIVLYVVCVMFKYKTESVIYARSIMTYTYTVISGR